MTPVVLFNANTLPMTVGINNPPAAVAIGGTNANLLWQPQAVVNKVAFDPAGPPRPNVLAPGDNNLAMTPQGQIQPWQTTLSLPASLQWMSIELYIYFFKSPPPLGGCWLVLNNGQYVTGGGIQA